jgi:orotidine-5'-phosphate decarboxylase
MRSSIVFRRGDEHPAATRSPLVLALDTDDLDQALDWAERAGPAIGMVKVGLELFCAHGDRAVRALTDEGHGVMLDLKLHDIPTTVTRAVRAAADLDVELLTVHALGGPAMLAAAVAAAGERPAVAAVTVLTSHTEPELGAIGLEGARAVAERLGRLALDAGCPALVCSAREAPALRDLAGPGVQLVCPGVRVRVPTARSSEGASSAPPDPARSPGVVGDDQARVATPAEAVTAGADWLVVGRPITGAADPAAAAAAMRDQALAAREAPR